MNLNGLSFYFYFLNKVWTIRSEQILPNINPSNVNKRVDRISIQITFYCYDIINIV